MSFLATSALMISGTPRRIRNLGIGLTGFSRVHSRGANWHHVKKAFRSPRRLLNLFLPVPRLARNPWMSAVEMLCTARLGNAAFSNSSVLRWSPTLVDLTCAAFSDRKPATAVSTATTAAGGLYVVRNQSTARDRDCGPRRVIA